MFAVGFSMHVDQIAEEAGGPTEQFLAGLAAERKAYVMAGVVGRQADGRGLNQAVMFDPTGREIVRYEAQPVQPGRRNKAFRPRGRRAGGRRGAWQVAPLVCYDLRFPEVFRRAAQLGANLMVVIANWPVVRIDHWTALLAAGDRKPGLRRGPQSHGTRPAPGILGTSVRFSIRMAVRDGVGRSARIAHDPARSGCA